MDILDAARPVRPRSSTSRPATSRARRSWRTCYGRLTGRAGRRDGDAGSRRDQPRHRHRGRVPRPRPDGGHHRPGRLGQDSTRIAHQFVDIVRMFEPVTKWNQRVEQVDASRRSSARRSAWPSSRSPDPRTSSCRRTWRPMTRSATTPGRSTPTHRLLPRADRRGHRPCRPAHRRPRAARSSWPATASCGATRRRRSARWPAALHVPVAVTFMGKGAIDDRSHLSLLAVGLQARDHVLTGFDRADLVVSRRLRPRRVRARRSGTPTAASGSSTSTPSRPRSTPRTGPRSS